VLVILEGENKDKVRSESGKLAGELRQLSRFNQDISIIGPSMAPLSKLVGKFRVHILLRGNKANEFRKWLHQVRHVLCDTQISGIKITVDVDPKNLL
jgi:primosomal protein N'